MSEKLFNVARWLTAVSFVGLLIFSWVQFSNYLFLALSGAFIPSFVYTAFFKCRSCGNSYASKKSFISTCWPYTSRCRNCGEPLKSAT